MLIVMTYIHTFAGMYTHMLYIVYYTHLYMLTCIYTNIYTHIPIHTIYIGIVQSLLPDLEKLKVRAIIKINDYFGKRLARRLVSI